MLVILKIVLWVLGRLNLNKESVVDLMKSSGLLSYLLAENTMWDVHISTRSSSGGKPGLKGRDQTGLI